MAGAIRMQGDYTGAALRRLERRCSDAAGVGGGTLQIVRDWVLRFNAEGHDGLTSRKAPGKASFLNEEQRRALLELVEAGPIPSSHGVVGWRLIDLAQWVHDEFGLSITKQTLSHEMRALGYRKLSARPCHRGQRSEDIAAFKKNFPARVAQIRKCLPPGTPIELWWQDEARIGQQTKLTRRWGPALSA
jgi:transposase